VDKGELVPDNIVVEILKSRISQDDCKDGFILDGFPRNLEQAEILDKKIGVDKVILIDIPDEEVVRRLSGRLQCPKCNAIFGIDKETRPKITGVCDKCGEKLFHRKDDEVEIIKNRLVVYHKETEPVLKHYKEKGILVKVPGIGKNGEILEKSEVAEKVWEALFEKVTP
jgi:adenylate kinase